MTYPPSPSFRHGGRGGESIERLFNKLEKRNNHPLLKRSKIRDALLLQSGGQKGVSHNILNI